MLRTAFLIHCILALSVAQDEFENIDKLEPIMRTSPEMGQFAGDLFGYTAVLHKLRDGGGMADSRIVVSAPYGQAQGETVRLARSTTLQATGVIYTCPLNPGSCEGLRGDGAGEDRRLYDVDDNLRRSEISDRNFGEEKRGQFLGATLKSTGTTFLTCAHRRLDFGAGLDRNPYGVCYISGRGLEDFIRYEPCSTASRSFFGHGQCQAGTSGDIIDGDILVGAPGTFAWRGAVFRRSAADVRSSSSNGVGSSSISWQGYEVVTGRINSQSLDFIVSVPRFNNYIGRVNIYANTGQLRPVGNPPLAGDQIGAYYGFSMAAVDLQGRGMDDLLISAPLYSPEVNSPEFGRVYVYRNNQGSLTFFTTLEGRIRYGRFGHAMAKLGDINGDSFEDVAISAPFGGEDVPGTVYIYAGAGAGTSIINQNPIQIIVGNSLNLQPSQLMGLMSFGSSLSSNVDVDNNGYNDLVIGAFQSQRVFVLRTHPVARLEVTLNSDDAVDLRVMPAGCNNRPCFNISVCMQYGGRGLLNTLNVNYTLEVDPQRIRQGLASRVTLLNQNSPGSITGSLVLNQAVLACVNTTAIVEERTILDISSPFTAQFTPTLVQNRMGDSNWNGNMEVTRLDAFPLLTVIGETSALTQYVTSCGNRTCQPDLNVTVMMENVTYEDENGNVISGAITAVSGITTAMEIPVLVVNNGDDAFGARISVMFDSVLTLSRVVPPIVENMPRVPFTCFDRDVSTDSVSCVIANQFLANETRIIIFRFQTNAITGAEGMLETIFTVTSQPAENATTSGDNTAGFNISIEANVNLRLQLSLTEESIVLGETNPDNISDVADFAPSSSLFDAIFSITNLGSTRVPFAQLSIYWPLNAPDCDDPSAENCRRFFLYPIQADGLSCETEYINTLDRELEQLGEASTQSPGGKRRRRQAVEVANVTEVSCINGMGASCVEIICNITNIARTARVSIQAIPDNRQFFGTTQNFEFTIHGRVEIVGDFVDQNITDNEDMDTLVGITAIAPPSSQDDEIPAWVIIVPIVIGVLIIIIIVVALYFLGFFKLKKVDKDKDEEELNQDGDAPDGDKQPEASEL